MTQLNNEELNKVSGGFPNGDRSSYESLYIHKLDKYETVNYIGQDLLFKSSTTEMYGNQSVTRESCVLGTLINSYEKTSGCKTVRTATINVINYYGYITFECNSNTDISLDKWTAFAK